MGAENNELLASTSCDFLRPVLYPGDVLVGDAAERRSLEEPGRAASGFKRRLGDPTPLVLGGSPYGATHVAGNDDDTRITDEEKRLAIVLGKRLAEMSLKLAAR